MIMKKPAYFALNRICIDGVPQERLMVVMKTAPCIKFLENDKCLGCSYDKHCVAEKNPTLLQQFSFVRDEIRKNKIKHLDILGSGSILDTKQVDFAQVLELMEAIGQEDLESVLIEGRVEFFDLEKIRKIQGLLGDIKLEYGVGLEAWSDNIRNDIIGKSLEKDDYINFVKKANENKVGVCTYVLAGIPKISAVESFNETVNTIINIADLYNKINHKGRVALFPFFVADNGEVNDLYDKSIYALITLSDIVGILEKVQHNVDFKLCHVYVGMDDEGLSKGKCVLPKNGEAEVLYKKIDDFNYFQEI